MKVDNSLQSTSLKKKKKKTRDNEHKVDEERFHKKEQKHKYNSSKESDQSRAYGSHTETESIHKKKKHKHSDSNKNIVNLPIKDETYTNVSSTSKLEVVHKKKKKDIFNNSDDSISSLSFLVNKKKNKHKTVENGQIVAEDTTVESGKKKHTHRDSIKGMLNSSVQDEGFTNVSETSQLDAVHTKKKKHVLNNFDDSIGSLSFLVNEKKNKDKAAINDQILTEEAIVETVKMNSPKNTLTTIQEEDKNSFANASLISEFGEVPRKKKKKRTNNESHTTVENGQILKEDSSTEIRNIKKKKIHKLSNSSKHIFTSSPIQEKMDNSFEHVSLSSELELEILALKKKKKHKHNRSGSSMDSLSLSEDGHYLNTDSISSEKINKSGSNVERDETNDSLWLIGKNDNITEMGIKEENDLNNSVQKPNLSEIEKNYVKNILSQVNEGKASTVKKRRKNSDTSDTSMSESEFIVQKLSNISPKKFNIRKQPKLSRPEIERELKPYVDYDCLLDFLDFGCDKERLNYEDKEILLNLCICIPWDVPPTHLIETRMSSTPTKEQRSAFEKLGIKMQTNRYTQREDNILLQNWEDFCKLHNLRMDPKPFLNFESTAGSKLEGSVLPKSERINFVKFLGRDLQHRYLYSIYQRFRKLFNTRRKGKFTETEDKIILQYLNNSNTHNQFSKLTLVLNRDRRSILLRYKTLTHLRHIKE